MTERYFFRSKMRSRFPLPSPARVAFLGAGLILTYITMTGTPSDIPLPESDPFVRTDGTVFLLKGELHRFVGVNYWYAAWLGMPGEEGDRDRLKRELDTLQQLGLTNLRILGSAEASEVTRLTPVAQPAPGDFNEAWFEGLDYAMAEISKRGMHAVIVLSNYWNWSGGMPQYVTWTTGREPVPDNTSWADFNRHAGSFYTNEEAQELYRESAAHLVRRINTVNGVAYREDPAIFSWQIANEPRPGNHPLTAELAGPLRDWIESSARYLKTLGAQQMISTGNEGVFGCNGDEALYRAMHEIPEIDYLTAHLWPQNWSWFDPFEAETSYIRTEENARAYIEAHIQIAEDLGKPLVFEEFGLSRDQSDFRVTASTHYRDQFFALVGEAWHRSGEQGKPLQGLNIWTWSGEGRPVDDSGDLWMPGNPIMGDNPSEPQGWYAVYDSDESTIALLRDLAQRAAPQLHSDAP